MQVDRRLCNWTKWFAVPLAALALHDCLWAQSTHFGPRRTPVSAADREPTHQPGAPFVAPEDSAPLALAENLASQHLPSGAVETASFNGLQPGKSTPADLKRLWGEPSNIFKVGDAERYVYATKPFRRIEVQIDEDFVSSIMIHFETPFEPDALTEKLKLSDFLPVEVSDERGERLGRVFPERGVLFSYSPYRKQPEVSHILLEAISPEAFVLRAQHNLPGPCGHNLADLDVALQMDPQMAEAHWMRGEVLFIAGQTDRAKQACVAALQLDPGHALCRLTLAKCYAEQGDYDDGLVEIQTVLAMEKAPELVRARALMQRGEMLAAGPGRQFEQGLEQQMEAIKLASPFQTSTNVTERRAAKEIVLEAHLGIARSIGWGNWKRKPEVVAKWIQRAEALAEDLIAHEEAGLRLELLVAKYNIWAHAGYSATDSVEPAIAKARETAQTLLSVSEDPLWQASIRWELGSAYAYAVQMHHFRGEANQGLEYGRLAENELEAAGAVRDATNCARTQLGQLYANLGAIHALQLNEHDEAVRCYEKATPLLLTGSDRNHADAQRLGETLVSMGVSYWEANRRQQAIEITEQGTRLLEQAVQRGTADKSALAVPYGNLASMHEALGDDPRARDFADRAEQYQAVQASAVQ